MTELFTSLRAIVLISIVLGLAYPLAMTGAAQTLFGEKADGDPALIGTDTGLFKPRPSVTGYDPAATFFNNLGPNQKDLADLLRKNADAYLEREGPYTRGLTRREIPTDAVTTSASGVDPSISLANARIQANRVAAQRGLPVARVLAIVQANASRPGFGRKLVNVVELNREVAK
jgi:K+-transporting ATPase ATPase C chain